MLIMPNISGKNDLITYQRRTMTIFWNMKKLLHMNNPRIDDIYKQYVDWFDQHVYIDVYATYITSVKPINKYIFRAYIRRHGYKNGC